MFNVLTYVDVLKNSDQAKLSSYEPMRLPAPLRPVF